MKTVVIFSHSYPEQSVSGKAFLETISGTEGIEVRNLEELYPDGNINVATEQSALESADLVVFYHPVFWFALPSLLKKYMDDVYTHGWAYGTGGDKLRGKKFLHVYTTGQSAEAYNNWIGEALEAPLKASAGFVGYEYLEPMPLFGQLAFTNPNAAEDSRQHTLKVIERIKSLG